LRRLAARRASCGVASASMQAAAVVTCHLSEGLGSRSWMVREEVEHRPPLEFLAELRAIEQEILQGIEELEGKLR
jgi:hypothetical protein